MLRFVALSLLIGLTAMGLLGTWLLLMSSDHGMPFEGKLWLACYWAGTGVLWGWWWLS